MLVIQHGANVNKLVTVGNHEYLYPLVMIFSLKKANVE